MKKLITLLLLASVVVTVYAQSAIVLKMRDGQRNVVYLQGPETSPLMTPYVTFEADDIVVHGDHELRVAISDVLSYHYTGDQSGITTVGNTGPMLEFKRNEIAISNQPEGTTMLIYNVSGMLVKSVQSPGSDFKIPIDDIPQGVYLIKIGGTTYKFLKR